MDTFAQLKVRTRRWLKELDADTSFWTDDFLSQIFNSCYWRRCAQMMEQYEGWFINVATRELTAEKDRYAHPTGHLKTTKIELVRTDGRTVPVEYWERHDEVNYAASNSGAGDNYLPQYRMLGNGFVLEPTPIETVSGGLRIEFAGLPAKLEADNDRPHPSFPEIYEELLVLDTASAALDAEQLHETGQARSLLRLRNEWELDFLDHIKQRKVSRNRTDPAIGHYIDA